MAKSGRRPARPGRADSGRVRWIVGLCAVVLAAVAIFVLLDGDGGLSSVDNPLGPTDRVLDDIDAESREAMRDLLRDAGN